MKIDFCLQDFLPSPRFLVSIRTTVFDGSNPSCTSTYTAFFESQQTTREAKETARLRAQNRPFSKRCLVRFRGVVMSLIEFELELQFEVVKLS